MNHLYNYKDFTVLYVDDEILSLKYFKANFEERFEILTASSADEALALFEQNKDRLGIIITDQRMPAQTGVQFLEKVRQQRPKIVRMLATAYSDLDAAVAAVNNGAIYKYISKPWDERELEITLMRAMEFFIVQNQRDSLLREKVSAFHRVMMTDRLISLGLLASGLSHHLRNALVAVRVFLDLAPLKLEAESLNLEELRNPDYWHDFYKTVQAQMAKATGLLDNLGSVPSRPPAEFGEKIKFSDLMQNFSDEKGRQAGWNRAVEIASFSQEPAIQVDQKMFSRFLDLLFDNLHRCAPQGSALKVAIAEDTANKGITIKVTAEGLQLPENSIRHIFDPFYVQNEGPDDAGLNLLICYFIIYHHGGQFTAATTGKAHYQINLPIDPQKTVALAGEDEFLDKVFATEASWERLLIS